MKSDAHSISCTPSLLTKTQPRRCCCRESLGWRAVAKGWRATFYFISASLLLSSTDSLVFTYSLHFIRISYYLEIFRLKKKDSICSNQTRNFYTFNTTKPNETNYFNVFQWRLTLLQLARTFYKGFRNIKYGKKI